MGAYWAAVALLWTIGPCASPYGGTAARRRRQQRSRTARGDDRPLTASAQGLVPARGRGSRDRSQGEQDGDRQHRRVRAARRAPADGGRPPACAAVPAPPRGRLRRWRRIRRIRGRSDASADRDNYNATECCLVRRVTMRVDEYSVRRGARRSESVSFTESYERRDVRLCWGGPRGS